jgi:type VI secretion system secreted protein Hcp
MALAVVMSVGLFELIATAETTKGATTAAVAPVAKADRSARGISMLIQGEKQGQIKGAARDGSIGVISYTHEIVSPRDHASGLPTGKRMHKPFVITKELDKSTPLLMRAMVTNENLPTVEFRFADQSGVYFTVKLTNASLAGVSQMPGADGTPTEQLSFTYQKIEWTWVDGGITASDDWESPVQ